MQAKAFNPQVFLELLCYSAFGGLFFYLTGSEKYLSYVTPRMKPYLYFTAIVMGIWALADVSRIFRPQHRIRFVHCFVLVIPVLLLLLPHTTLSASDFSANYSGNNTFLGGSNQNGSYSVPQKKALPDKSGVNPSDGTTIKRPAKGSTGSKDDSSSTAQPSDSAGSAASDKQTNVPDNDSANGLSGLDTANKKIMVSNDNFGMWLSELYKNMDKYKGYTVVMTGFVFKDPKLFKEDEFVPARLMMTCCVADLSPAGLLCKYDKASELKADSWVTVEGTLFIGQYVYGNGVKSAGPQLTVTKVSPAKEVEGYIYPY